MKNKIIYSIIQILIFAAVLYFCVINFQNYSQLQFEINNAPISVKVSYIMLAVY